MFDNTALVVVVVNA